MIELSHFRVILNAPLPSVSRDEYTAHLNKSNWPYFIFGYYFTEEERCALGDHRGVRVQLYRDEAGKLTPLKSIDDLLGGVNPDNWQSVHIAHVAGELLGLGYPFEKFEDCQSPFEGDAPMSPERARMLGLPETTQGEVVRRRKHLRETYGQKIEDMAPRRCGSEFRFVLGRFPGLVASVRLDFDEGTCEVADIQFDEFWSLSRSLAYQFWRIIDQHGCGIVVTGNKLETFDISIDAL